MSNLFHVTFYQYKLVTLNNVKFLSPFIYDKSLIGNNNIVKMCVLCPIMSVTAINCS